jgi:hypothetical protein
MLNRFFLVRVAVTLMTLSAVVASLTLSTYRLPFDRHGDGRFAIITAPGDAQLWPALRPGDRIVFGEQSARVRSLLVAPDVPPDTSYPFVIHRGDQVLTIPVATVPTAKDGSFLSVVGWITVFFITSLGLLTLWRGTSWSAWGLTLFTNGVLIGSTVAQTPAAPFGNLACGIAGFLLTGPAPLVGLYLTALDLTGRSARSRPRLTLLFIAVSLGLFLCEMLGVVDMVIYGVSGGVTIVSILSACFAAVMLAVPLVVLTTGYVAAGADQKLRIRWVLASTAMLVPLLLTSIVIQLHLIASIGADHLLTVLRALLTASIFGLYAYAVLSQRLVAVRIVINRALVFGALMMMVVGSLGAVESLIERTAVGAGTGTMLELTVPLALGVVFHRLHGWIEATVDRLVFRAEHQSRAALQSFVRDAGFIESAEVLIQRVVATFARHSGGRGAALFELRGGGMECLAQDGDFAWPDLIDPDDPGLVRLRATLCPVDLHGLNSALGDDGLAMPLALRGRMFGVLVCGPRAAGRFAQTEVSELGQAARDVGASLFALRARANELLIERMAQGSLQLDRAVVEARRLAGLI